MEIVKLNQLLKIRGLLQQIGNQTFNYSILNKQHPIRETLSEEDADLLIESYNEIITKIAEYINDFSNGSL